MKKLLTSRLGHFILSREQMQAVRGGVTVSEQYYGYVLDETNLAAGCPDGFYCGDAHGWVCYTSSGSTTLVRSESAAVGFVQSHPSVGAWCTPR